MQVLQSWGFGVFSFFRRDYKGTFNIHQNSSHQEHSKIISGKSWNTQNNLPILTWKTVINVTVTVSSSEARLTLAQVAALDIMAQSVIFAGLGETFINIHCTSLPWNTESPDVRQCSQGNRQKPQCQSCSARTGQHLPAHLTFPARGTLAGVAFRVRRFLANS